MTTKLGYLDALRGLAAIVVVVAHSVAAFYPHAIFGEPYAARSSAELWLRLPPLSLALAGHGAVCLFFILSGYVLSLNFLTRPIRPGQLAEAMLKRPVRLGGLVVFTVLTGYVLMLSGALVPAVEAGGAATPWLAGFWQTTPTAREFLLDLFLEPFASGTTYNPPLWTIHKELVGSYLVFGYVAFSKKLGTRSRWIFLAVLGLLTFRSLYVGFVLGLAFAQARPPVDACRGTVRALSWGLLIVGLWLGSQLHYLHVEPANALPTHPMVKLATEFGTGGSAMLGALCVFAAFWLNQHFQHALDRRVLRFFGRVSFALYALHFLVLGSLTWHAYRSLEPSLGHHAAALVATVISYATLVALSQGATRWIDQPSTQLANALAKRCVASAATQAQRFSPRTSQEPADSTALTASPP